MQMGDIDILTKITPGQTWATACSVYVGLRNTITNSSTTDRLAGRINGSEASTISITRTHQSGGNTTIATANPTLTGSSAVWLRFRRMGDWLGLKVWDDGTREPEAWSCSGFDSGIATSSLLFPFFQSEAGAAATARTFDYSPPLIDDLRPFKARPNFRRI